jgi:hypothetical protein
MFIYYDQSSGFQPLNYGFTLLVSIPVAFVEDVITQSLEMAVIRKELASKNLPVPPSHETTWDEYAQQFDGAQGSKRRKILRALKWMFTYGFVERSFNFVWARQLMPNMLGDDPGFWLKFLSGLLTNFVYFPVSYSTVFGLTSVLDYRAGFDYIVKKIKKDLCKVMMVGIPINLICTLIFTFFSWQTQYVLWWFHWSFWGIYLDHMSHLPADQPKDVLLDIDEDEEEDVNAPGTVPPEKGQP